MRRIALALAFALVAVGCRSQVPPNPTVYTCPASTGTAYSSIGTTSGALTITDSTPVVGTRYCYIVQSTNGTQVSLPSNTSGPVATTGLTGSTVVQLNWLAPTTGVVPTGYTASRAVAIQSTILAPALSNGQVADIKPALTIPDTKRPAYALLGEPPTLLKTKTR